MIATSACTYIQNILVFQYHDVPLCQMVLSVPLIYVLSAISQIQTPIFDKQSFSAE